MQLKTHSCGGEQEGCPNAGALTCQLLLSLSSTFGVRAILVPSEGLFPKEYFPCYHASGISYSFSTFLSPLFQVRRAT